MSDYAFVADRARKVFASVSRLESELAQRPDDWSVQRNLRSMQKLASQARAELERLASANQIEICAAYCTSRTQEDKTMLNIPALCIKGTNYLGGNPCPWPKCGG